MKREIIPRELIETDNKKARILVVDDNRFFLTVFSDLISDLGYGCLCVENGLEALEKVKIYRPDIVILDIVMPGLSGFDVLKRLKENPATTNIPVIMLTSLTDKISRIKGLESGANEFLHKPLDESEFKLRIKNLLKVRKFENYLIEHGKFLESEVKEKAVLLDEAYEKIRKGYVETTYKLTIAAEFRDKETGSHIKRISFYSQLLARYLELTEAEVEIIFFASPMHDVGKIGIPDAILLKPDKLSDEEFEIMKSHTTIGGKILHGSESEILKAAEQIALTHHERWNGKGYPKGLKGEEIPMSGRIVMICDIYDALRSKRTYKDAYDHKTTCNIIHDEMSESFDPLIFRAFQNCADEFKRLYNENQDSPGDLITN